MFARAGALVRARQIDSDADAGPLLADPPPDIDPEILKRLRQMYEAGGWVLVESALADVPGDLRWLYESGAVTIGQLAAIHGALGSTSAADLAAAVREEKIRAIPGLDVHLEAAVGAALPALRALTPRLPLGRASAVADAVLERLRDIPGVAWALPVGSLRRGQERSATSKSSPPRHSPPTPSPACSPSRSPRVCCTRPSGGSICSSSGCRWACVCRIRRNAGADLLYLTGSAAHFEGLRARAAESGWRLTADGLHGSDGTLRPSPTEDEIYAALGLPPIPAEIREGTEEIARRAAASCRRSWRAPTFAATCTCTPTGATGAIRLKRWCRAASRSATSTWRSPTTRRARRRPAT